MQDASRSRAFAHGQEWTWLEPVRNQNISSVDRPLSTFKQYTREDSQNAPPPKLAWLQLRAFALGLSLVHKRSGESFMGGSERFGGRDVAATLNTDLSFDEFVAAAFW